jgi:hypothetical protein
MTPLEGSSVSPGGKAPAETVQAYGVVPPTAVSALEYATPTCPSGIQLVDSCKVPCVIVNDRVAVLICAGLPESVTLKLSEAPATAAVGVPVMAPVAVFSDNPAGNVPLVSDQVYGVVPPDAVSVAEYAAPTSPFGSDVLVMVSVLEAMVSVIDAAALCAGLLESVTVKVSGALDTTAVGVPVMAPVAVFRDNPAGSVPPVSDQV